MTPTSKNSFSITEKGNYKEKKRDQLAANHLQQELLK